jgi:hypothetical protein
MQEFLSFRKMLTPMLVQVLFWVGVGLSVIAGIASLFSGSAEGAVVGLVTIIVGPIAVRVWCEVVIVLFRINDRLGAIEGNTKKA